VSLTEEPEAEIPVARLLAERYSLRKATNPIEHVPSPINPFDHERRHTHHVQNIGGKNVPRVIMDFSERSEITAASLFAVGCNYSVPLDKWNLTDLACDFVYCGNNEVNF
jgi:(E)-4-hydroxy-3-methylbut-2-enyl-diphosphate synthase